MEIAEDGTERAGVIAAEVVDISRRAGVIAAEEVDVVDRARRIATEVLLPLAAATDAAPLLPPDRLDALAAAGLYGLVGPVASGGLEADEATVRSVSEALASGCLTTTFVWMQHHNAVGILTALAPEDVADRWLADLCGGRVRAGVAFAGLRRPGAPLTRVARTAGGFVLSGSAPWVTGWGIVDVVHTAARDEVGDVHWLLVDAVAGETLRVEQHDLIAAGASGTVTVSFADHPVPSDRLTHVESFEEWRRRDARGLGRNGSLALGVATRATELLGDPPELLEEISSRRDELARADADEVPAARARASLLALDATTRLFVAGGGRSTIRGGDAERLVREALFLQVFGQTPAIKDEQLRLLTAGGSGAAWPRPNV